MRWTHRNRIVIAAIVLSLCTQILLVGMGIINSGKVDKDIEADSRVKLLNAASYNVAAYLSHMNSMLSYFQSKEFGEYVQSYMGFDDTALVNQKTDRVNLLLNQIHMSDNLMDSVYILGSYKFQKGIVIHDGDTRLLNESVPTINDLLLAGLLPTFTNNTNKPIVYTPGELTGKLKISKAMPPEQSDNIKKMAKALEGRVLLSGGPIGLAPTSYLVIIVMKKGLLTHLVNTDPSTTFTLLDQDSRVLERTEPPQGTNITIQSQTINPSGIKLELSTMPKTDIQASKRTLLLKYLLFFLIVLLATVLIAFMYSHYLILPFRKLSSGMKKQRMLFPLQYINKDKVRNGVFPPLSLRNKLLILFFLAVFIPAISSGIGYYQFINQFSIQQMKPYVKQLSQQVNMNIQRQAIIYEDLINKLTLNNTFVNLLLSFQKFEKTGPNQTPDISFLQYSGISDIAYFVLYNSTGSFSYSNQNAAIASLDTPTKTELANSDEAVWVSNIKDIYNQPTISLIKQVSDLNAHVIGYIQIVLNQSAFQSILLENTGFLLTMNKSENVLFQNEPTRKAFEKVKQVRDRLINASNPIEYAEVNGISGIATVNNIKGMNWNTFFMESMEPIITKRKELFVNYLIVIFSSVAAAMIAVYGLTRWLIRSLEHLKLAMEQQILEVKMEHRIVYKARDEISDLIDSFNRMMAQINELMVTNIQIAEENNSNRMKQQELLSLQTQSELKMLQLQINPHFLYNTLQSIGMRAKRSGEEEVGFMVYALADLFRYSIRRDGNFVDLSEEIRHTENYIAIQEFRFKDKFTVEWSISSEALNCKVIKFILQPLVENAISHGILNSVREGKIWITASLDNQVLALSVKDNGVGIEPHRLSNILNQWKSGASGEGLGLNNVYFRLQLIYNGAASMEISSERFEGTNIQLYIPQ